MQYFFFFIVTVLTLLLFGSWIKSSRVSFNRVSLVMIILVVSGYWGVTYLDTVDMPGYYEMYSLLEKGVNPNNTLFGYSYNRFEPAFIYLMQLCKNVGLPFWGFQSCLLFFEVSLLGIGFYRLLNDDWLLACFLVSISLYLPFWLMAAMRQGIPIAVFLFVLPDIVAGNYKKPIILVLLAS